MQTHETSNIDAMKSTSGSVKNGKCHVRLEIIEMPQIRRPPSHRHLHTQDDYHTQKQLTENKIITQYTVSTVSPLLFV